MEYSLTEVILMVKEIEKNIYSDTLYKQNNFLKDGEDNKNYEFSITQNFKKWVKKVISTESEQTIYLNETVHQLDSFYGVYFQFKKIRDKHIIVINASKHEFWRRFSTIKEYCQIYLDHGSENIISNGSFDVHNTNNYIECIEDVYKVADEFDDNKYLTDQRYDNETCALLMATELMIPYRFRKQYTLPLYERSLIPQSTITMYDIASSLRMPEIVLKRFLESGLITISNQLHETLPIIPVTSVSHN